MGLNEFKVIFDRPNKTYFAGEILNGQVLINLNSEKTFKKIKVELEGYGNVHWKERKTRRDSDGNTEHYDEHYRSHENYVEMKTVVHNGPSLPAGIHYFPFSFMIPGNLPSSFETHIGQVRYYVKAQIVRDWKWDHRAKGHIMINGVLDLNQYPSALQEGNARDQKNLCCWPCKSGPISAVITSNRAGYVPGEFIGFSAEVENLSNRDMSSSFLNLVETVKYRACGRSKVERRIVAEIIRGSIAPGSSDYWEGVTMRIPSVPPTHLAGSCSIMDVQYTLDFHVDPSGPSFDLVVSIPIIIGTIPLREYMQTFVNPPAITDLPPAYGDVSFGTDTSMPNSPWVPSAPAIDQFNQYPDLPPPSYNESIWGMANVKTEDDDDHTQGDWEFMPRYPTWNTNY